MTIGRGKRERMIFLSQERLAGFDTLRALWHETPEEIEAGLQWGAEKARLLRWVRSRMRRKLTLRERRCLELYFLEGLTYREIGAKRGVNASSAHRAVRRALRKLRAEAMKDGPRAVREPRVRIGRKRGQ